MAWMTIKKPYISKKTGTVVKYLRDTNNPNITKKIVNVGPKATSSKIARSEVIFENSRAKELNITTLSLGEAFKFICTKTQNGWKRIFG